MQQMVDSKGTHKEMRQVLMEKGAGKGHKGRQNVQGTEVDAQKCEKTKVNTMVTARGHSIFIPKLSVYRDMPSSTQGVTVTTSSLA